MSAPVGVVGGGSFGQGLALAAARAGREVILWSRSAREVAHDGVSVTSDESRLRDAELVFVAAPSHVVAELGAAVGAHLDGSHLLVHVSRGLVGEDLHTLTQVLRETTPCRRVGALAGPLVAEALRDGTPSGAIVGSRFDEVADAVHEAIAGPSLRIYETPDVIGVEVASAMGGLIALAAGFAQGMGFGPATLGMLVARGMAEAVRVGEKRGCLERTFSGLAGYGDLIAAMAGDDRPELRLGRALARGASLEEAGREAGAHIEGVGIARRVSEFAARVGIATPISDTVAQTLHHGLDPHVALERLMARDARTE